LLAIPGYRYVASYGRILVLLAWAGSDSTEPHMQRELPCNEIPTMLCKIPFQYACHVCYDVSQLHRPCMHESSSVVCILYAQSIAMHRHPIVCTLTSSSSQSSSSSYVQSSHTPHAPPKPSHTHLYPLIATPHSRLSHLNARPTARSAAPPCAPSSSRTASRKRSGPGPYTSDSH